MTDKTRETFRKVLFLGVTVIALWAIQVLIPDFYTTMIVLTLDGDVQGLASYLSSFGYGAIVISVFMIIIANAAGLPSIPFLTVNGVIFGLIPGIIISWVGEVIGIEVGFILTRIFFRNQAQKLIERHNMLGKLDSYSNIKTITIARAVPYSPNVLFTALAALSRLSFRDHTVATLVGKIPAVVIEVWLGHDLLKMDEHGLRGALLLFIVAAIYIFMRWHKKHREKKNGLSE